MAYRTATLAGVLTNFFFGLLRAYVFLAVFDASGREVVAGYTRQDAVTYTALTQALISPLHIWGWWDVMNTIRSGEIAMHLTRPYPFYLFWMARDVGRALSQLLFRGAPILVVYPLLFEIAWPDSAAHWLAIMASVLLAILLSFAWRFLVNLSAFWALDAMGIGRLSYFVMTFLSGFLVPVALFPPWLAAIANLTPMPAMVNTPIEVYLGLVEGRALVEAIGTQAVWLLLLSLAAEGAFRLGTRRLVVQGG
jgi:ABC-2 type transport system permease protein